MPSGWIKLAIIALVFYFIGAKWPMLAQKVGLSS